MSILSPNSLESHHMVAESADSGGPQPLPALLRECLVARSTGKLAVDIGGAERLFFFVGGDLYLSSDHALAKAAGAPTLGQEADSAWLDKVLDYFEALGSVSYEFTQGTDGISTDLLGPIGTAELVMRGAVRGLDEFQLMRSLGGEDGLYVADSSSTLAEEIRLDPQEAFLLSRLEQPLAVKELLRTPGLEPVEVTQRLCRLAAVGLIGLRERLPSEVRAALVSPKLLERFATRIGDDLDRDPLTLEADAHRRKLADLMARLGGLNYYEMLGIGVGSTAEEIHVAYTRLARVVHPRHVPNLGLEGKEAGLELLFEKATEAYLTLSDRDRRGEYLEQVGAFTDGSLFGRTEESRREEVEDLAVHNFKMARQLVDRQDYYYAIELLNQAIRLEAQPEYFALLGHCQAQNPQWLDKAISSYGRAVQLDPTNADLRANLGLVYEKTGHKARARAEYQAALKIAPGHPEASSGAQRIEARSAASSEDRSWWQRLLDR